MSEDTPTTSGGVELHDVGKLAVLLLVIAGSFVLVALGRIDFEALDVLLGAALGYITGNGVLATRGKASSPLVTPKLSAGVVATVGGPAAATVEGIPTDEPAERPQVGEPAPLFTGPPVTWRPHEHFARTAGGLLYVAHNDHWLGVECWREGGRTFFLDPEDRHTYTIPQGWDIRMLPGGA